MTLKRSISVGFVVFMAVSVVSYGATRRSSSSLSRSRISKTSKATAANENLIINGNLDHPGDPLYGWTIDYAWQGNRFYMNNKNHVHYLPTYSGRKGIIFLNGSGGEIKMETSAVPFDLGSKYRCEIEYKHKVPPHIYFTGYKWKPGVRPYYDKPVHMGDLRRLYKSAFRGHKMQKIAGGWTRESFEFPIDKPSKLAQKHLKYMRYFTVHFIAVKGSNAKAWVDKVTVTKMKQKMLWLSAAEQAAIDKKNQDRKDRIKAYNKKKYEEEKKFLSAP